MPQEVFSGTVIRILPRVNTELRVAPVIVEVSNPGHRIKAGLSGFARLRVPRKALTVPGQAVLRQGGKAVVFRVEKGRARVREVRLGTAVQDGEQEVSGGLTAGDEVVVYQCNFYKHYGELTRTEAYLQDNDLVDTDWRRWARRE
jgi:Cu(I)/Ag(I) efflux system membrane fusion protein